MTGSYDPGLAHRDDAILWGDRVIWPDPGEATAERAALALVGAVSETRPSRARAPRDELSERRSSRVSRSTFWVALISVIAVVGRLLVHREDRRGLVLLAIDTVASTVFVVLFVDALVGMPYCD